MRGAGNPQAHWAVESQIDIIAEKLGMDPIEIRLKNHIGVGECFYGQSVDVICDVQSCGTEELIRKGADAIKWSSRVQKRAISKRKLEDVATQESPVVLVLAQKGHT